MTSVIVVENELLDSVREYGEIIDASQQNHSFSESVSEFVGEEITNKKELAARILQGSTKEVLTSLSNKEFEPAFYLLVHLISVLEGVSIEQLLEKDSKIITLLKSCVPAQEPSMRDRRSLRTTTILSAFNTFFNLLPVQSPSRVSLIKDILSIVAETQTSFALIQSSIGDHLVSWLKNAGASEAEIKSLFWSFIALDKQYTLTSLELIKAYSAEFTLSLDELRSLIQFALASSVVDVSFLVNNNVAAALQQHSSDDLVKTFIAYTKGDLITSVSAPLSQDILAKSKIMALAKFFVEQGPSHNNTFKYSDIPSELVDSSVAFEKLLVDSIKAGVLEGKLNQVDETFYLVRVNRFILAGDEQKLAQDWDAVKAALLNWKHSLENINQIVLNAKENIVNNSNAN